MNFLPLADTGKNGSSVEYVVVGNKFVINNKLIINLINFNT